MYDRTMAFLSNTQLIRAWKSIRVLPLSTTTLAMICLLTRCLPTLTSRFNHFIRILRKCRSYTTFRPLKHRLNFKRQPRHPTSTSSLSPRSKKIEVLRHPITFSKFISKSKRSLSPTFILRTKKSKSSWLGLTR